MNGMFAIAERELRKFFHSPLLLFVALVGPLLQLVLMGHAFGGKISNAPVGIVDNDHGNQAVRLRLAFNAISANVNTFRTVSVSDEKAAQTQVASGRLKGAVIIPSQFTARVLKGESPHLGLLVDNTDQVVSGSIAAKLEEIVTAFNTSKPQPRMLPGIVLDTIELYPYVEYIKFLLPGLMALAIFLSVVFGGVMLFIEDRARGVHEGFLVTPISKFELVSGIVLAGTVKATVCTFLMAILGSTLAGVNIMAHPASLVMVILLILVSGFTFNAFMFLMVGNIQDPMIPKILTGILNTLLYFPSGAIYPVESFPAWLRILSTINPMTYTVHGFRMLLLKNVPVWSIVPDVLFLLIIGTVSLLLATRTFKRTL